VEWSLLVTGCVWLQRKFGRRAQGLVCATQYKVWFGQPWYFTPQFQLPTEAVLSVRVVWALCFANTASGLLLQSSLSPLIQPWNFGYHNYSRATLTIQVLYADFLSLTHTHTYTVHRPTHIHTMYAHTNIYTHTHRHRHSHIHTMYMYAHTNIYTHTHTHTKQDVNGTLIHCYN